MPIDPAKAIGAALPDQPFSWTSSDVLLYHLAIGAGQRPDDPVDAAALRYTFDDDRLQVLPSFGIVAPHLHRTDPPAHDIPGVDIDLAQVLHGSQSVTVHGPISRSGAATLRTRVSDIWDKGKAAVIVQSGTAVSDDGDPLWTVTSAIFVRGEGGWGGARGPSTAVELPERAPDAETTYAVAPQQALLYRLCGDRNPLHADPAFAARAGFPRPILHGLCSYGIVLREVTDLVLDRDASRVGGFTAKFAGIVFPGESIRVEAWDADESIFVRASIAGGERDGSPVLSDAVLTKA